MKERPLVPLSLLGDWTPASGRLKVYQPSDSEGFTEKSHVFIRWPKLRWPVKEDLSFPQGPMGRSERKRRNWWGWKGKTERKMKGKKQTERDTMTSFHCSFSVPERVWDFKWWQTERLTGNRFGLQQSRSETHDMQIIFIQFKQGTDERTRKRMNLLFDFYRKVQIPTSETDAAIKQRTAEARLGGVLRSCQCSGVYVTLSQAYQLNSWQSTN